MIIICKCISYWLLIYVSGMLPIDLQKSPCESVISGCQSVECDVSVVKVKSDDTQNFGTVNGK